MTDKRADQDFADLQQLKSLRANWDWYWQKISDYVIPRRSDFTVRRFPGQRRDFNMYDSTAPWALDQLSAGLHTLLTSQALPWFYLKFRNPSLNKRLDIMAWLDDTRQRINDVFNDPNTHFQSQMHELYNDLGGFGTAVLYMEYDKGVRFSTRFLGECFIKEDAYGVVNTLYRVFELNRDQAISVWGAGCPSDITNEKDPLKGFAFLHVVKPNGKGQWDSRYYWADKQILLREGHYKSFPYAVPRWTKSAFESYGRSPAMTCLADILTVNEMTRTILRAAHKAVDPPLLVPDDGFIQAINTTPGATNYYDSTVPGKVDFLESKGRFDVAKLQLEGKQEAIIRAFYVDMLQLPGGLMPGAKNQNTYMTATEANIRRENTMRVLGPVTARLQNELLNPIITRVYDILKEQRSLAPPPAVAHGESLDIVYVSPLATAQQGAEVDNYVRWMQQIQPIAAINPNVLDGIALEKIPAWIAKKYNVDPELINSPAVIAQIQQQRAQQAQAEQAETQENTNLLAAKRNTEAATQVSKLAGAMRAT